MNFIKKYWLGICSAAAIMISGFFLYDSFVGFYTPPSSGIARTAGRSIAYASMLFFVINSLRKRWEKKKLEFWIFCFAVSFSLCSIYDSFKVSKQIDQLNNTKQEFVRFAEDLEKESPQLSMNEYSVEQYGDFSKFMPLIKKSFDFSEKMTTEINMACADLENILDPAKLCEDEHIVKAKQRLVVFVKKLNHFEKEYEAEYALMQEEIKKAFSGNDSLKREALVGYEKGKKTSNKLMKEFFYIEKKSAQKIYAILNFLSTKSGTFWESNGILIFEKDEDVDGYNQLVQNLVEHGEKEEIFNKKLEMHRHSVLQKMKNFDQD